MEIDSNIYITSSGMGQLHIALKYEDESSPVGPRLTILSVIPVILGCSL